jgi:hypothetical protein
MSGADSEEMDGSTGADMRKQANTITLPLAAVQLLYIGR